MSNLTAIFGAEIKRYYRVQWSHLGDTLAWMLYTLLVFAAAVVILEGVSGGFEREEQLLVLVGWLTWVVASDCMSELPHIISEEAQTGTLEQVAMLAIPLWQVLVLRSLAYFLGIGLRGLVAAAILLIFLPPQLEGGGPALIVLFLVSLLGAYGMGFLFAGLAVVVKRTEAATDLVFSLMIFLTGSLVGLESLGRVFDALRLVFPLTWAISLMRQVAAGEQTLSVLLQNGSLGWLLLHSLAYLLVGLGVFGIGYRRARVKGTLSHY